MIRAILSGSKTQTRRVIKPQPVKQGNLWYWKRTAWDESKVQVSDLSPLDLCSFQIGMKLWVREPYSTYPLHYKADGYELQDGEGRWHSAIFMPQWASRITLEIVSVRVERVAEITHEDAIAEGAEYMPNAAPREQQLSVPQIVFAGYWDSLNAKRGYSWASNSWVWAIEFRKL